MVPKHEVRNTLDTYRSCQPMTTPRQHIHDTVRGERCGRTVHLVEGRVDRSTVATQVTNIGVFNAAGAAATERGGNGGRMALDVGGAVKQQLRRCHGWWCIGDIGGSMN